MARARCLPGHPSSRAPLRGRSERGRRGSYALLRAISQVGGRPTLLQIRGALRAKPVFRMRRMTMLALVLVACASTPEGTVSITLGEENDALSRAPAPTTLVVETVGL